MIELSVVRDLVTILGVLAGFSYYILTIQNANKIRKTQLFIDIYDELEKKETHITGFEILYWDWSDFDDWLIKYGPETNPEANASFLAFGNLLSKVGFLVREGMIDVDDVYNMMRSTIVAIWERTEPIILGLRERYNTPTWMENWEYIYNEMKKIDAKRFPELKT